jgi:hypothetical protein
MSLNPVPRETLRGLKAQKDEELRQEQEKQRRYQIHRIVSSIYGNVLRTAETTNATLCSIPINTSDPFTRSNLQDTLTELKIVFPDCSIEHSMKGKDGKMYVISQMDVNQVLSAVHQGGNQEFIIVDWS